MSRIGSGLADVPASAAWRHLDARVGFEVVFLRRETDGYRIEGHSTAVEGLWHIGASTHPGPGLGAGSGTLVAKQLLRRRRWR